MVELRDVHEVLLNALDVRIGDAHVAQHLHGDIGTLLVARCDDVEVGDQQRHLAEHRRVEARAADRHKDEEDALRVVERRDVVAHDRQEDLVVGRHVQCVDVVAEHVKRPLVERAARTKLVQHVPDAREPVGDEHHHRKQQHDLERAHVLHMLQQPHEAAEAQQTRRLEEAQHRGRVAACNPGCQCKQVVGNRRREIDPEPELHVVLRDEPRVTDEGSARVEERGAEVHADVDRKHQADGIVGKLERWNVGEAKRDVYRHGEGAEDDQQHDEDVPECLVARGRVDDGQPLVKLDPRLTQLCVQAQRAMRPHAPRPPRRA
mmetsp:Transcript_17801/g.53342  ORF Transcript_17801/g.53342 Transcript_17801/m.53342 type:complete len:319 (+) Transcript_17801:1268-2224(+)